MYLGWFKVEIIFIKKIRNFNAYIHRIFSYLLFSFKELAFTLLTLLLDFLGEILVIKLLNVYSINVDLGWSGNNVRLVHPSQWNTINLEWTWKALDCLAIKALKTLLKKQNLRRIIKAICRIWSNTVINSSNQSYT